MNRTEMLLVKLAEECNEVGQRAAKALRFGLEEIQEGQPLTNAERIREEYLDLVAAIMVLVDEEYIPDMSTIEASKAIELRKQRIEKYMDYSREVGALTD